jgi:hypothetical protein
MLFHGRVLVDIVRMMSTLWGFQEGKGNWTIAIFMVMCFMKIYLLSTIMAGWVTTNHLAVLNDHKPLYDAASTDAEKRAVLKDIARELRDLGKKGLPRSLRKVIIKILISYASYNLYRLCLSGTWLRMEMRMMEMIVM